MKISSFIGIIAGLLAGAFLLFWILFRVAVTVDLAKITGVLDCNLVLSDILSAVAILGIVVSVVMRSNPLLAFSYCLAMIAFIISYSISGAGGHEEIKAFGAYGIALIIFNAALVMGLNAQRFIDDRSKIEPGTGNDN